MRQLQTLRKKAIMTMQSFISFLVQFDTGKFQPGSFAATVGIGFTNKTVTMTDNSKVKLQIWDTAGQERFRSITHAYYRDAHALLLLYDVTSKASFDNIRAWLAEIHDFAQEDAVILLIGNKADMTNARTVRKEDGERLANEFRVTFMETSAKSGLNVETAFRTIASFLRTRQDFPKEKTVRLTEINNATSSAASGLWKCCGY
ncbi:ras-related protein Rab-37-like isoform X2 [Paramacrobiotus metropolitanus]|uniref:ras-related protein Rab-37-like isoform X2 n=1 Tax=Paramacrobiotus metropolitanus TaxID=2943436 RepID=UPI00244599DE|nr:ras-related protein Rab-37-like isoform X2 [Paramacrobiotus metropolitanus]